jgi:hypothetical membrane protein
MKFIRAGALLWMSSLQYYVAQVVVAAASAGYGWGGNTISDLGNTACGMYGGKFVCSPWHLGMNLSLIILGLTMTAGAVLLRRRFAASKQITFGFGCMALAGVGTVVAGVFPENSVGAIHAIGAALPFVLGNVGMIVLGLGLKRLPVVLRAYTVVSGLLGLIALTLFLVGIHMSIGPGGMERLAAYPQSIWLMIFGLYMLMRPQR